MLKLNPMNPVFRMDNGRCMTGAGFNEELKGLLGKYMNYDEKRYLAYNLRSGYASMMAEAGYSNLEIM